MIRILLVDDEKLALRRLSQALKDVAGAEIVGIAMDGEAALKQIRELQPDLVLLDVEMPGLDGIEVARAVQDQQAPEIVFCSAFDRYATDAFSVEAVDYLLKPVKSDRLLQAVARAQRRLTEKRALGSDEAASIAALDETLAKPSARRPYLHLPDRHGGRDLPQADIIWIEAAKDYALIHTRTRSHILRTTMVELAAQLQPSILRVHRSAFVGLGWIRRRVNTGNGMFLLQLDDEAQVAVGPTYAQQVRATLRQQRPDLD